MRNNDSTSAVVASVGVTSLSAANAAVDTACEGTAFMVGVAKGFWGKLWAIMLFPSWPLSFWFFWWKCKLPLGTSIGSSLFVFISWMIVLICCFMPKDRPYEE